MVDPCPAELHRLDDLARSPRDVRGPGSVDWPSAWMMPMRSLSLLGPQLSVGRHGPHEFFRPPSPCRD